MLYIHKLGMGAVMDVPIENFIKGVAKLKSFDEVIKTEQSKHFKVTPTNNFEKYIDRNIIDSSVRHIPNRYIVNGVVFELEASVDAKKNNLYGGSLPAWSNFLCQMYILCKKDAATAPLVNLIKEVYQDCFTRPLTGDPFLTRAGYTPPVPANDIVMSDDLIIHEKIIELIKKYKKEIGVTDIEVDDILRIADRSVFSPILNSTNDDNKDKIYLEVTKNKHELENILLKIKNSGFDKPKIYHNIFDADFHQFLELSLTILKPKPKNEYSIDEIFDACKELDLDRVNKFVKNFIGDEDGTGPLEAENAYKSLLKEYLDSIAAKNDLITKKNNRYYSVVGAIDKVLASLGRLYGILPPIEKRALAKEILMYARG